MATIRTSIQLNDLASRQFHAMNMAMSTVIDSFQEMHDVTGKAIDVSALNAAQRELQQVEAHFNEVEQEIRQAEQAQSQLNQEIREGTDFASGFLGKIGAIAATYLSFQSVKGLVGLSDQLTDTTARLNLMNDNLMTTQELQDAIFESAQRTFTPYQATADMVGKLGMQARAAFSNNLEIVAFAEQINKTFSIAGTSAEGIESVMLQLTQAMASGVLQGEELNAILDNAQPIVANIQRYLEEAMNIDASNIKQLASEGVITAEVIKNAMFWAAQETNAAFASMPTTWSQLWTNMQNHAEKSIEPVLERLNEMANSDRMAGFIQSVNVSIQVVANLAAVALDTLATVGAFVYDHWSLIEPVVWGAAAAMGAYGAALLVVKASTIATAIWTGLKTLALGLMTATSWSGVAATWSLTAAQWGLNAALAANPVFLIVLAVIALIAIFYLAVAAINHFTGESYSATGLIAGFFMWLGTAIWNVLLFIANMAIATAEFFVNVWNKALYWAEMGWIYFNLGVRAVLDAIGNAVMGAAEWIANTFNDCVYGVQMAFYKMSQMVLKIVGGVADGAVAIINKVLGAISDLINGAISGVNSFIGLLNGVLDTNISTIGTVDLQMGKGPTNFAQSLQNLIEEPTRPDPVVLDRFDMVGDYLSTLDVPTAPERVSFERFEYKSLGDAWDKGYEWGANLFGGAEEAIEEENSWQEELNKILGGLGDPGSGGLGGALDDGAGKLADAIGKGSGAGRKTAANTKRLADSVDMAVDELEYLRDLAEREAMDRTVYTDITVDMSGMQNTIDSELDIDGVIDRFAEKLEEAVEMVAEGDY